jgi:hypothetical protein
MEQSVDVGGALLRFVHCGHVAVARGGACSVSRAEPARACSPGADRDQQAAEPLPLRGRATVSALEPRDRWSCSKAAMRADRGRALLIGPFSTVSRETLASVAERNCYAGGSVSHGLIGSPTYRYRRPSLLIATSGAVMCCWTIPLGHRRVCASPAITDLFPHRSIPRSAMAAEVNTKACEAGVEGLRTAP